MDAILDTAGIEQSLREQFPAADRITQVTGGHSGVPNYLVDDGNETLLCKLRPRGLAFRLARVSRLMTRGGVPHGRVVGRPFPAVGETWVVSMQYLLGRTFAVEHESLSLSDACRFGESLGEWLARLHSIRIPGAQWQEKANARFESKLCGALNARAVDRKFVARLELAWEHLLPSLATAPTTLIHRDLHDENILLFDGTFAGVVDFEQARAADPMYDFVKLLDSIFSRDGRIQNAMTQAYGIDLDDHVIHSRLTAAQVLEYMSAIVYFDRHKKPAQLALQAGHLERVVAGVLARKP